jgi:hypothetical protein
LNKSLICLQKTAKMAEQKTITQTNTVTSMSQKSLGQAWDKVGTAQQKSGSKLPPLFDPWIRR